MAKLAALDAQYPNRRDSYVVMPLIPWNPYQNDFWYNEILNDIQARLDTAATAPAPSGWRCAIGWYELADA